MKTFVVIIFIGAILGLGLWGLSTLSTSTVVEIKKEDSVKVTQSQSEIASEEITITMDKEVVKSRGSEKPLAKVADDVPANILIYLQDDVLELKGGMSLQQVDKIWGAPDEVEKEYYGKNSDVYWHWGEFFERDSKLEGPDHYKTVKFRNGKLSYWTTDGKTIKIKTHTRFDLPDWHLVNLDAGMSKLDVYKLWGVPANIDIDVFADDEIGTDWHYNNKKGRLSHYADFVNNKLYRWGDF